MVWCCIKNKRHSKRIIDLDLLKEQLQTQGLIQVRTGTRTRIVEQVENQVIGERIIVRG